jgi:hypothetical protein
MLLGRFLVGTGMGLGPPVASLYITEVCRSCFPQMTIDNVLIWFTFYSDKVFISWSLSMSTSDGMQVSPSTVRGTYGSFVQIATCLGIIVSLLIGTPVKDIDRW